MRRADSASRADLKRPGVHSGADRLARLTPRFVIVRGARRGFRYEDQVAPIVSPSASSSLVPASTLTHLRPTLWRMSVALSGECRM